MKVTPSVWRDWRGFFVSSVHVVKFKSPVRESRTPSSEGLFWEAPRQDMRKIGGVLCFLRDFLRSLDCQLGEADCFIDSAWMYCDTPLVFSNMSGGVFALLGLAATCYF